MSEQTFKPSADDGKTSRNTAATNSSATVTVNNRWSCETPATTTGQDFLIDDEYLDQPDLTMADDDDNGFNLIFRDSKRREFFKPMISSEEEDFGYDSLNDR